ncbi:MULTISPECIES: sugar phosphate isomerase/epimerase [unclassified Sphingomonas]|uniref:sugar phosphate isomerase/epimerase family protein n=1 Tax=unclassified Sphingomonas TaxID=196159 RepID=UPI00226A4691|nr:MULTISPECIES: sugar phosphate isomerase/epimerase [unclassified Sphingomonas]
MIMDRRHVLMGLGGTAALAMLGMSSGATAKQVGAVGLQLFTVRDVFEKDPVGTLEKIARIGYREVEFGGGGYDTMDHAMLRRTLDRLGLKAPSVHIPYPMLTDRFDAAVTMAKTLGAETVILPWLPDEQRTEAGFEPVLRNLDPLAKRLRAAGLGFAYHNHDFEFTGRSKGVRLYDRLIAETDPTLVKFELDLYWAAHAGADLPGLVKKLGRRLYSFHVKDMRADRSMAAVGTGTIDFAALFRLPSAAGVRHFFVENDEAPAPYFPDIATSYRNLAALRF